MPVPGYYLEFYYFGRSRNSKKGMSNGLNSGVGEEVFEEALILDLDSQGWIGDIIRLWIDEVFTSLQEKSFS